MFILLHVKCLKLMSKADKSVEPEKFITRINWKYTISSFNQLMKVEIIIGNFYHFDEFTSAVQINTERHIVKIKILI